MRPHRSQRPSLWFPTVLKAETQVLPMTSKPSGVWPLLAPSLHLCLTLLTLSHFTLATFAFLLLFEYSCLKLFALALLSPWNALLPDIWWLSPSLLSGLSNVIFSMKTPWSCYIKLSFERKSSRHTRPCFYFLFSLYSYLTKSIFYLFIVLIVFFPHQNMNSLKRQIFLFYSIHFLKQHLTHFVEWLIEWISWWSFWPGRYIHTAFPKHLCNPHIFLIKVH